MAADCAHNSRVCVCGFAPPPPKGWRSILTYKMNLFICKCKQMHSYNRVDNNK